MTCVCSTNNRSRVRAHVRRTVAGPTGVSAHSRNRASGKRWSYVVEDQQTGHRQTADSKTNARATARAQSLASGHAVAVIAVDAHDGKEHPQGAYYGRSWRHGAYTRTFSGSHNRTSGVLGKHGDFDACGSTYKLHRQKEGDGAPRAYCPACGNTLDNFVPGFSFGTIVKRPARWLKSMRTAGIKKLPINGRIVGGSEGWPIVEWSDGTVGSARPDHLMLNHAVDRTGL